MIQQEFINRHPLDLSGKRVLLGLSGGINSAAILCYLASEQPPECKPLELHIFAIQLKEHSPDTFRFMKDCIRYAAKHFAIRWTIKWGSVLKLFAKKNTIPHPMLSPCSEILKQIPLDNYRLKNSLDLDLIGFVRSEQNRIKRQAKFNHGQFIYPIAHLSDDDCFDLVKREIGWYPAIYDIRRNGERVFKHNNCLPCKNMQGVLLPGSKPTKDYQDVALYYPGYFEVAEKLADDLNSYWGRVKKVKADNQLSFFEDGESMDGYCHFCEL